MIQTADNIGAAADTAGQAPVADMSIMGIIVESNSWYILIPLLLMSIYAIYIFVERLMALSKADKGEDQFMSRNIVVTRTKLDSAKNDCEFIDFSKMVDKGVSRIGKPMQDIKASVENVGKLEISRLENNVSALATISGIAPMIGFLGTVLGMIKVFYDLKNTGIKANFLESLSGGIMMAMVTTVAGLIVGILAYFFYNFLVSRVSRVVQNMEAHSIEFIDILEEPGK